MLFIDIALIVIGALMEIIFFANCGYLPFQALHILNTNSVVLGTAIAVAVKWFLPLGIIAILLAIADMTQKEKTDDKINKFMVTIGFFYLAVLVLGIL